MHFSLLFGHIFVCFMFFVIYSKNVCGGKFKFMFASLLNSIIRCELCTIVCFDCMARHSVSQLHTYVH